ncbi:hypothetical protein AB0425_37825 [Actinosynnema sp. NPDC051121]
MLTPSDQGHFRKYLTTLGVAIIVGSIGLGGFFLQAQGDLSVEQEKLSKLTPTAQEAIQRKQGIILVVAKVVPYAVAGLTLAGLTLTGFGLKGWSRRQRVQDRRDDIELDKLSVEFTRLTQEERKEKAEKEASELVKDQRIAEEASIGVTLNDDPLLLPDKESEKNLSSEIDRRPGGETGQTSTDSPYGQRAVTVYELRDKMLAFEKQLARKLQTVFEFRNVFSGVRINRVNAPALEADVYVRPAKNHDGYAFEVKYVSGKLPSRSTIARAMTKVALAADSLNSRRSNLSRDVIPILVLVTKGNPERLDESIQVEIAAAKNLLPRLPVVLRYSEDVFHGLTGSEMMEDIRLGLSNLS